MRISPPKIVIYGRTWDDAYDLICTRHLRHCEPGSTPWLGLWIGSTTDLTLFGLRFAQDVQFVGHLAIVPPSLFSEVEEFLIQTSMEDRVQCHSLTAVRFWDTDDEDVFAEAWG